MLSSPGDCSRGRRSGQCNFASYNSMSRLDFNHPSNGAYSHRSTRYWGRGRGNGFTGETGYAMVDFAGEVISEVADLGGNPPGGTKTNPEY